MRLGRRVAPWFAAFLGLAAPAVAHPVPFSYIDVRLEPGTLQVTVVAHIFDIAHDLGIDTPESLLDAGTLAARGEAVVALLRGRVELRVDGVVLAGASWSPPEVLPERESIRVRARHSMAALPGRVDVAALMFPYDPRHRTFLNVYEGGEVASQAILEAGRARFEYYTGSRQGRWAVLRRFVPAGVHHILIGPDHLLFLAGLLLLGGSTRQLLLVVTAFTIAHSITLSLAALRIVVPPAHAIEPAIALSVVYVGADNLLVRTGGRDTRAWIAFAFGLVHGFGFANVLRDMDLPTRALGWTLFGFNLGVEFGQLFVVLVLAVVFNGIRRRSERLAHRLAVVGSVVVILAGTFWFVERVFFSGGSA